MKRRRWMGPAAFAAIGAVLLLCLIFGAPASGAHSTEELLRMTQESLRTDWATDRAFVRGVGRIVQAGPSGRLLARRAALLDARRGLLLLREEALKGPARAGVGKIRSVSGQVPPVRILSERSDGALYFVEVEAALSELLTRRGRSYAIWGVEKLY